MLCTNVDPTLFEKIQKMSTSFDYFMPYPAMCFLILPIAKFNGDSRSF